MAEDSSRETEDMKVHRHQTTSESFGGPAVTTAVAAPALNFSPHLLTSSSLGTGPNHFLRAGIVQGAQRTLGNRAVQRYLSVQRCGDSPCGCPEEEKARHALQHRLEVITETPLARSNDGPSAQRTFSVQRQPGHAPADPNYTGTTPGDAYVGPGNGAGIGGLVSYGCYCGPGGDAKTGSRCGPGAPPKDAIDATCMRHDSDYGKAGVDSGSAPGTVNMFTDVQGWLKAEEADRRLADSVDAEMDANPGAYSPSARLFGQGIKGIFGGRANVSHAMNWGINKYDEAKTGLTGAYDDAANWGSNKASEAEKGVSSFIKSAAGWNSVGDAASGIAGGAADAANWLGKSGMEAAGGVGSALGSAGSWLGNTVGSAVTGGAEAAWGLGKWGLETAGAIGGVGLDLAGRGARAVGNAASDAAGWVGNKASGAWDTVTSWW